MASLLRLKKPKKLLLSTGELRSHRGTAKPLSKTFEKQAPQMKAKPAVLDVAWSCQSRWYGKPVPTTNSKGQPIADSAESARNFWRWFGDHRRLTHRLVQLMESTETNKTEDGKAFGVLIPYGSNYGLSRQGLILTDDPEDRIRIYFQRRGESPTVYPWRSTTQ